MDISKKESLLTKKNHPIKTIVHQDIYALYDLLERLSSWNEPLTLLSDYFGEQERPLNKRKVVKQYYAYSKLFEAFYTDFQELSEMMEQQLSDLRRTEKLRS